MSIFNEESLIQRTGRDVLNHKLGSAKKIYDYILIDTPPNWRYVTQMAMFATDVILAPTRHNDVSSLVNIAEVIKRFIPEVRALKKDGTPEVLPIFFNGQSFSDAQLKSAQENICEIISEYSEDGKINLEPYFFSKSDRVNRNMNIHHLPESAITAKSGFKKIPAVLSSGRTFVNYKTLAEEYFLQ